MLNINAPAKLNLYLKVLSKRSDGYHEIKTLFERIDLCDTITVKLTDKNHVIRCNDPRVPTDKQGLIGRTVARFVEAAGYGSYFDINISKKIPVAAGLGGGSSDAAAVLKGLNEITEKPLKKEKLIEIGRELGADLPFFINDYSFAYGKGRGDEIERGETSIEIAHILVNPPFEIHTGDIYSKVSAFSLTNTKGIDKMFNAFLKENDINAIAENICNDLQPIVLQEFSLLQKVFVELKKAGAKGTLLSGSGPAIFGIFDKDVIKKAKKYLKTVFPLKEQWEVYDVYTY